METTDGATCDSDKHGGEQRILSHIGLHAKQVGAAALLCTHPGVHIADIPYFRNVRHLNEQANKQTYSHKNQCYGKYWINLANDFVDRQ